MQTLWHKKVRDKSGRHVRWAYFREKYHNSRKYAPPPLWGDPWVHCQWAYFQEITVYTHGYRWFPWGREGGNNRANLLRCSFIQNLGKESITQKCTISDKFETRRTVLWPVVTLQNWLAPPMWKPRPCESPAHVKATLQLTESLAGTWECG